MKQEPGRIINSAETPEVSGDIGGKTEKPISVEDLHAEMSQAEQSAQSFTDMYRDYLKKAFAKEEEVKKEMEMLWGMKERGTLNLTAEDLNAKEKDGMEEAATLRRIAEGYKRDAAEALKKADGAQGKIEKLGSSEKPN